MPDASVPASVRQPQIPPPGTPAIPGLMTLAVGVVVLAALYVGRDVFLPIVLGVLLAFVITPFVDLLRRFIGRVGAVIVAVAVALGIVLALGGIIGLQVAELTPELPRYQATVNQKLASLREGAIGRLPSLIRNVGRELQAATEAPQNSPPAAEPAAPAPEPPKPVPVEVHQPEATPVEIVRNLLLTLAEPLATMGLVFVVLVFILLQREDLRDRMIRLFGASDLHRTTIAMDDAGRRLSRYFLIQLGLNASFGVVIAFGLWMIGLPSPLLWGIVAALMRFVPYIGSVIAAVPPVALAAAVEPGWTMALSTIALFLVAEPLMGQAVEPLVYGQSTGLSPFAVVVSAIFWTWLWGPVGLLISTPLTLCLVVLGRHVERLEFLDVLFGDRPALTPAENLYQRMLAGDPDEALESAEHLLKERSLTSYYDEVALRALRLAADDANRGVLTEPQLERVMDAMQALVNDLSTHDDVEPPAEAEEGPVAPPEGEKPEIRTPAAPDVPPPEEALPEAWRADGAVMCIAGRGPLDEAASIMLAQLLRKHGLGARVVPHEALSRSAIRNLDTTGVQMVCVAYVEIRGTPAHLRYMLRRLKQRLSEVPVLAGLWPEDEAILADKELQAAVGADYCVSSLRDAVVACRNAATEVVGEEAAEAARAASAEVRKAGEKVPLPA